MLDCQVPTVIAYVVRGDFPESVHHGVVVGLDGDGREAYGAGESGMTLFPRSALKLLQAVAMVRAGLDLDGERLAVACASHSGEPFHLAAVRRILADAGLTGRALQNTPDWPLDGVSRLVLHSAGQERSSLAQNCSGKHAAMLATCVRAGWDTTTYRDPGHPLQRMIRDVVEELTDVKVEHVAVDGCGAPLFSTTVAGLARAFARIATAPAGSAEHRVAEAIRAHPAYVGGTGRDVTTLIERVPGLIAKDGAEGVYAAALPDGRAVALKVLDGSQRARPVVMAAALTALGVDPAALAAVADVPVLGHGERVGQIEAVPLYG